MQVLILVAGKGERLLPLTLNCPKCLIEISGKSFLERMINNLLSRNLYKINLVLGFKAYQIRKFLSVHFPNIHFHFCYNNRFDQTNNSYSLYLAKNIINEDFLLFDGDLIFDVRILDLILKSKYQDFLLLRQTDNMTDEEMKIRLNENNKIIEINKNIDWKKADGESIGIAKFSYKTAQKLFKQLEQNILNCNGKNEFYEKSFQDLINANLNLYSVNLKHFKCYEVDFVQDIHYVESVIIPLINS